MHTDRRRGLISRSHNRNRTHTTRMNIRIISLDPFVKLYYKIIFFLESSLYLYMYIILIMKDHVLKINTCKPDKNFCFCIRRSPGKFIGIRSQQKDTSPDGSYTFSYETENGISASESGYPQVGPQGQTEVNNYFIFFMSVRIIYLSFIYNNLLFIALLYAC